MTGRVESTAKSFGLPFDVLVARDSGILSDYSIVKLPRIIVIGKRGNIVFTDKYASYERLKEEVQRAIKKGL
jgi:hypothetical protein